ncbi:hypothetical protein LSAT2_024044 [Lamellibrachia satsuma]|nr:hypothetical protein LSAT2_024044 [Lamellibrachia satsuma]
MKTSLCSQAKMCATNFGATARSLDNRSYPIDSLLGGFTKPNESRIIETRSKPKIKTNDSTNTRTKATTTDMEMKTSLSFLVVLVLTVCVVADDYGETAKCVESFSEFRGKHAHGAVKVAKVNTLKKCKTSCLENKKCLSIDFNTVRKGCWIHVKKPDSLLRNRKVNHYSVDRRCPTTRCGGVEYDRKTEQCCGGRVYSLSKYRSCCNDRTPYTFLAPQPAYSGCCNGVPYVFWEKFCCRQKTLHPHNDATGCLLA